MKRFFAIFSALFCGICLLRGAQARLLDDGTLELDGWRATLSAFTVDWHTLQPASAKQVFELRENRSGEGGSRLLRYRLNLPGAAPGTLTLALAGEKDDAAGFRGDAVFERPSPVRYLCLQGALPVSQYGGVMFEADGKLIRFPEEYGDETVFSGPARRFRLPTRTGEILLEGNFFLRIQDGRKWDGAGFGMRIGFWPQSGEVGETKMNFRISHGKSGAFGVPLGSVVRPAYVAAPGPEWKAFEYHRNVEKGSALDFSGRLDAPAGKYGPVVAGPDGRFVFRDRPDVPVRFYGANFVGDSQLPNREQAEELADRMARFGFNAVRIHHHDNEIYDRSGREPSRIDPERMDRLEYFLACLKKRGIYYTTDVYVSRRNIPGSELGRKEGIAAPAEYKALFYVDDAVYADWEKWARAFLCRVNPHTGLALKDDPALITLSLVNEGNPEVWWSRSPRAAELYKAKFGEWQSANPGGTFPQFLSGLTVKRYRQMEAFLRGLGCRALLTDQNFRNSIQLAADRSHYDFVDNHAYWDHPRFAEKQWQLPVLPNQGHPLKTRSGVPGRMLPTRHFGKGFTVTEFDYANPNVYRAAGPALMAACAAFQDWDGLFPFAYSHSLGSVVNPARTSGFFDIATDPVKAFSQRIGARLFLAGGIAPAERAFAAVVTEPFRKGESAECSTAFSDLGLLARIGLVTGLPAPGGVDGFVDIGAGAPASGSVPVFRDSGRLIPDLVAAGMLPAGCHDPAEGRFTAPGGQLELNRRRGTLRVSAPGGEVAAAGPGETVRCGRMSVGNRDAFAVFALLPVDSERIGDARRLVLMHLTNTQPTGMRFGNDRLDRLEAWGRTPFLARRGTAEISLKLPQGAWKVHALDTAGRRIGELSAKPGADGALVLGLDNFRYPEAVFAYEVVR
ncbi:MAG: hypothetical protein HPZ91_06590 [Lentisphaeria bacterium]|nr:hypothetical protein [Lentisphaeria bacterium]